jgi:hypothetical protein
VTSRRQFLQIGITATAWPIVARAAHATSIDWPRRTPIMGVVYDTRFAGSVAFAGRSTALGLRTHAIAGDMTHLWYDEIYHHWKQRSSDHWQQSPTALAGLTAYGPLFCFAELARDVGMRVVFKAEHRPTGGVAMTHSFTGPVPMLSTALDACARPQSIWTSMADLVARCPSGRSEIASAQRTVGTMLATGSATNDASTDGVPANAAPSDADTLYTWVIAPAVKV